MLRNPLSDISRELTDPDTALNDRKRKEKEKCNAKSNHRKPHIDLYIVRINTALETNNSKPCYHCIEKLKKAGINRVFYSTGENDIYKCEKIKNITNNHVTLANRHSW